MNYNIFDNNIKVELNSKQQLLQILEQLYLVETVFSVELQFTDLTDNDNYSRYCRCYLTFDSIEEATKFCFKLMDISQI